MKAWVLKLLEEPPSVLIPPDSWVRQWYISDVKQLEAWFDRLLRIVRAVPPRGGRRR